MNIYSHNIFIFYLYKENYDNYYLSVSLITNILTILTSIIIHSIDLILFTLYLPAQDRHTHHGSSKS